MYRLVILSIFAVTALAADLDKRSCIQMFHPHTEHCCKSAVDQKEQAMSGDDIKECFKLPKDPRSCEHELCIAKIKGFATDDGKLDKQKFIESLAKEVEDEDILADVKKICINGDLEQYGPPDACEFMKMRHCITMPYLNSCPEWNGFGECNQLKEVVADCMTLVNS